MSKFIFHFLIIFLFSCSNPSSKTPPFGLSFEVNKTDTFNRVDNKGLKQGKWYIIDSTAKTYTIKDSVFYKDGAVLKK